MKGKSSVIIGTAWAEAEFMNVLFCWDFLGIILIIIRLEVSVYNVYTTNLFPTTFAQGEGGVKSVCRVEVTVNSKEESSKIFVPQ
jgi:hypothetical protein